MANANIDDALIRNLITRLHQQLNSMQIGGIKSQDQIQQDILRKKNEKTIVYLCAGKLNLVANGLVETLDTLIKTPATTDEAGLKLAHSQLYILDLLEKCLTYQWDHIKAQFRTVEGKDEKEKIRLKEKEEQILPPPLEDGIALTMLRQACYFIHKTTPHLSNELRSKAGRVLFQLSASNYETVFSSISAQINSPPGNTDEELSMPFLLIEFLNLNSRRLSELLEKLNKASASFKKSAVQVTLARVLRKAIWNWIGNYPMEFVALCQVGTRLPGGPDILFDTFDSWASSTSKKGHFWPLQTMLLILCPDIMYKVATATDGKTKPQDNKSKFLESLKKALKGKLTDIAAICYVDICKASTFVAKGDTSALRFIVPGIQSELNEKLFNPAQPFKNSDGVVDQDLMVDCLVSSFLLNPRKVINSLFQDCVKLDSPPLFKVVLVKCLLKLAQVGKGHLPWNPTIADVYGSHPANLRAIFQDYENKLSQGLLTIQAASSSDRKAKQNNERVIMDLEILTKLVQLFYADPVLALYQKDDVTSYDDIKALLKGLSNCASYFAIPDFAELAGKTLLELHKPAHIEKWNTKNTMQAFWVISAAVNSTLAELFIKGELKTHQIQKIAELLGEILVYRNEFLAKRYKDERSEVGNTDLRNESAAKLEVALLMQLCSPEPDICSKCAKCFGLLCDEADILSRIDDVGNPIVANYSVYKELATVGVLSTGQAAQQKAIRSLLRRVDKQTQGNYKAWQEVYSRWLIYTSAVLQQNEGTTKPKQNVHAEGLKKRLANIQLPKYILDKTPTEIFQEWTNYTGFLCALSGVLSDKRGMIKKPGTPGVEEYIQDLVELVISDNINVREHAKMHLGNHLSSAAFSVLFKHLHQEVRKFFGESGQVSFSDTATLFVDQVVSISKLIFEMDHTAGELSLSSDFEDIALLIVKYVRQLVMSVGSLQSKFKLCSLLEAMMEKRQHVSFRDEFKFRQNLVENILEWTSEFAAGKEQNITDKQIQKLIKDLDHQVLKTIVSLLHKLPLQGDDNEAKAKIFSKYFTFFTRLLTRCRKDPTAFNPGFAEITIQVLSHLVSANIDQGLEYFVTMGYHEDFETRSAFLKVLANILNQGAEFDAQTDDHEDKYYKLIELVLDNDLEVVMALCDATQITEADEVAQLLVRLFEANERTMDLIKSAILLEVMKTEHATTLFRRNSMATKLLAAYSKLIGQKYLVDTLVPYLNYLMSAKLNFELDPTKLAPGEDLARNTKNVLDVSKRYLDDIKNSVKNCPKPIREICNFMRKVVEERFPDSAHSAIGGFIFLRFFCPALVAPEGYGLIQGVLTDKNLRRGLVLVTKVLQNLSNKVQFTKEEYMRGMNEFINANMNGIITMFDEFAIVPPNAPPAPSINISDEQKEEDYGRLHSHLSRNLEKISRILTTNKPADGKGRTSTLDRLKTLLAQLGPPPEPNKQTHLTRSTAISKDEGTSAHFEKFMKTNMHKNTDSIKEKNIFYQQGFTKEKYPVFYYIARNFKQDVDPETMIYYILKTMQPFFNKPFVIVVDCTLFGQEHQLSYPWCNTFAKVFPPIVSKSLEAAYVINPNTWFKKYCKRVGKLVGRIHKKIIFLPTVKKIFDHIPENDCGLPAYTLSVEDVKASFVGVTKLAQIKKEVTVKISNDLLQIVSSKLYNIAGCTTHLTDLFHVSRLQEVTQSPSDEGSIIIKYEWNGQKTMTLRTDAERAVQMMQQLKDTQNRYKLTKPSKLESERAFRPSDVPGTLLNMALLNLTNTTHSLRAAAYNLLCALANTFSFSVQSQLLEANEICVPRDSSHFVTQLSKQLAASEPKLSLEFLLEALHGITKCDKATRHHCLSYIKPWIPNLKLFCRPSTIPENNEKYLKTREIVNLFITLTLRDGPDIGPAIQNLVWKKIGKVAELLDLVLDLFIERIFESKSFIGSSTLAAIENMVVAVASQNQELVAGKLIARITLKLQLAAENAKDVLHNADYWNSITAHLRFLLMLSFENIIKVEKYLPELFHLITLSFSTGSSIVRATVHSLLINIVHSFYTTSATNENTDAETLHRLRFHLSEFQHIKFRLLFGIGASNVTPFSKPPPTAEKLEQMSILSVETVATALLLVLNCTTPTGNAVGTAHHARWLSLTTATAFSLNSAHQPRAFVTLGVICKSPKYVTEDLLEQILQSLVIALRKTISYKTDDLPIAIINCLTHMFEHVQPTSKYFKQMFWIAMTIVQIGDLDLFLAAVPFIEVVLKVLDEHGCFKAQGLSTYLTSNLGPLEPLLSKMDQLTGINFKTSFSFAVACHMLKGLKHPTAKPVTSRVLTTFLDVAVKENIGQNILGYVAALLTVKGDELNSLKQILAPAGVDAATTQHFLFNEQMVPDATAAGLLFSYLVTVLKNCDVEHEQLMIYEAFKDGVQMMPEAFPVTYEILVPKIQQAIITSHNPEIIEAVLAITKSMFSFEIESAASDKMKQGFLARVGFQGMHTCDTFAQPQVGANTSGTLKSPSKKEQTTKIVCSIVESVIGKEVPN